MHQDKTNANKLSLVNKHFAKIMHHWHGIDDLILDSAFLSLMLLGFLLPIQCDIFLEQIIEVLLNTFRAGVLVIFNRKICSGVEI